MKFFILLAIVFFSSHCKPKNSLKVQDSGWQEESLKLTSEICMKLETCYEDLKPKIPKKIESRLKDTLNNQNCMEKSKKSNVYFLIGQEKEFIKKSFRECSAHVYELSCEEIMSGKILSSESCKFTLKIQSGNNL